MIENSEKSLLWKEKFRKDYSSDISMKNFRIRRKFVPTWFWPMRYPILIKLYFCLRSIKFRTIHWKTPPLVPLFCKSAGLNFRLYFKNFYRRCYFVNFCENVKSSYSKEHLWRAISVTCPESFFMCVKESIKTVKIKISKINPV